MTTGCAHSSRLHLHKRRGARPGRGGHTLTPKRPVHMKVYIALTAADPFTSARSVSPGEFPDIPAPAAPVSHPVTETILRRRSAREQFNDRPIPGAVLIEIVRCGLAAPSSKNAQPWRLHVVSDRAVLGELARAVETSRGADSYAPMDPLTGRLHPDWPSTVALSASVLREAATGIFIENRSLFSRSRQALVETIQGTLIAILEQCQLVRGPGPRCGVNIRAFDPSSPRDATSALTPKT